MSRWLPRIAAIALGAYALSGFYVVRGNEKAAVRRFGRLDDTLRSSGLHFDWPYPFAKMDRINFAEVRTVSIGSDPAGDVKLPLGETSTSSRPLLTGDQNLLQIRGQIQYRPSEADVGEYLFAQQSAEHRLADLSHAILADLVSHSGVDFAHVRGVAELNARWTARLRAAIRHQHLGIEIEQAVIEQVEPPARVKAEFLDVSNAQAESARNVQDARTFAEQQASQAESERRRTIDNAEAERRTQIAAAHGSADRFHKLIAQMTTEAERLGGDYRQVRQLTIQRMSWQTLKEIWPKIRKKTIVDGVGPVDVGVFPKEP